MITHLLSPEALASDPLASTGSVAEIAGDSYQHLFRSRRLAVGAELRLIDGQGTARAGRVSRIERKLAWVEIGEVIESREPQVRLHLLVGALRPERAAWLVEKATELGVSSCHFLATERTPRNYGSGRLERLRRVAVAAVEQCHRSRVPDINGVHPWSNVEDLLSSLAVSGSGAGRFVLDASGAPWQPAVASQSGSETAPETIILIGPEGGWSDDELAQLASWQVEALSFGPRILRVETAALAAAALWLSQEQRQG